MAQETVGFNITADSKGAKKAIKDIVLYAQEVSKKLNEALTASKGASATSEVGKLRKEMGITAKEVERATRAFSMYKTQLGLLNSLEAKRSAIVNDPERKKAQNKVYKARSALNKEKAKETPDASRVSELETKLANAEKALEPFNTKLEKITAQIETWKAKLSDLKPLAQQFVDEYGKALGPAQQIIDKVNGAASATDGLAGKADKANVGFDKTGQSAQETANAIEGLTTKEQQANDEQTKAAAIDAQETASLKDLVTALSQYRTELEQISQAGQDTTEVEQRIADTSERIKEKLQMPGAGEGIAAVVRQLRELKEAKSAIESSGMPKSMDGEYNDIAASIEKCKQAVNDYARSLRTTESAHNTAKTSGLSFGTGIADAAKLAKKGLAMIPALLKSVKSGFKGLDKPINKVKSSFNSMARSMRSNFKHMITNLTKYVLGFRSLFFLVRRLRRYIGEGIKNMAQFAGGNNHVNESITRLLSSLLFLKNAWATAFSPILQFVTPILETLIDGLAAVGNAFSRFIGSITGQTSVFQAVKVSAADYAKSLDSAGGSAGKAADKTKKLTDRLAAFDDLNVLGKDNDPDGTKSGGGGGGADAYTPDPNEMFKIIDVEDWSAKLKEAFASADFTEIGQIVGEKLLDTLSNIKWGEIEQKAYDLGKSIITFFNGALSDPTLWEVAGQSFANGLNTLGTFIQSVLENNQIDFGGGFATLINGFFSGFDEEQFKSNIEMFATQLVDNINAFFAGLDGETIMGDVSTISEGITTALVTIITGIDYEQIAQAALQIGSALLSGIEEGFKSSDNPLMQSFGELVGAISDSLTTLLPIIQPILAVLGQIAETILPIISDNLPTIAQLITDIATAVLPILSSVLEALSPWISTIFEVALPIIQAALDAIKPVLELLANTILPVLSSFLTEYIIPGVQRVGEFITKLFVKLSPLMEAIGRLIAVALKPFGMILDVVIDLLIAVLDALEPLLDPLVEMLVDAVDLTTLGLTPLNIIMGAIATFIKTVLLPVIQGIVVFIEAFVIPILYVLQTAMDMIVSGLSIVWGAVSDLADGWYDAWSGMADGFKDITNDIIGFAEALINTVIGGLNSLIDKINTATGGLGDLAEEAGLPSVSINKIKTVTLPRLAQGAVIPPNKEFMAVLGDQSHGTNIEAPLDTIKQAVAEVMGTNAGNQEVIQLLQQLITVVENKNLTIGDKEIGKANARYTNQQRMIRGTSF